MFKGIDLFSDTVTRPSAPMRTAMANAEVGDEQLGEDPTTARLEKKLAEWSGLSAATFFPTATMANEAAILLHCDRGDELLAAANCHLFIAEAGGPAALAGVMAKPITTPTGLFTGAEVEAQCTWERGPHFSVSRLLSVENTTNMGGGVAWPFEQLREVVQTAKRLGLKLHMDGARLFNAVVASRRTLKEVVAGFDTVTICLSKGLGCPSGAVLLHAAEHASEVRTLKQRLGGALRQSGILTAAALFALENNIARLELDHQNATHLAKRLGEVPGVRVENPQPSTNMVFFNLNTQAVPPERFDRDTQARGVRFSRVGQNRFRAVLHLDVTAEQVETAVSHVSAILSGRNTP